MKWSVGAASVYYIVRGMGYGIGIGTLCALGLRLIAPFDPVGDTVGSMTEVLLPGFSDQQALLREQLGLSTSLSLEILPVIPHLISVGIIFFFAACLLIVLGRRRKHQKLVMVSSNIAMFGTLLVVASFFYLLTGFVG